MCIRDSVNTLTSDVNTLKSDMSTVKEDVEQIKEDTEITRVATNTLVAWAEKASVEVKIPLFDKAQ